MTTGEMLQTGMSRVFLIEDGAGPQNTPEYLGLGRAGSVDWGLGDLTPQYKPDPNRYNQFVVDSIVQGQADLPTLPVEHRLTKSQLSTLLRIARARCPVDLHVHFGECADPTDFEVGWEKGLILETAYPSNYGTSELGAIGADEQGVVTETMPFTGLNLYEIKKLRPTELASAAVTDTIVKVAICDSKTCGACGIASDGCQVMFALTGASTGSPGLPAELLYSQDGGSTWASTNITSLGVADNADDLACVGTNLVVVSADSNSLHYASIADILAGEEEWTEVDTGFVALKTPNRIFSFDRTHTWIVADGGYVYFTSDPTLGVEVQDAGGNSVQNLNDVDAADASNAIGVGASNVVLATSNGGASFSLITGPAIGVALTAVSMKTATRWFVGTAGGRLYYTLDSGGSWTEIPFSGAGTGTVRDIQWATQNVGYMAHDTGTPAGRVLRTINGGRTWTVMPEEPGITMPTVNSILSLAACREDANLVLVGGTATGGTDGYLAKYA